MLKKTAVLFGPTGLIGNNVLYLLMNDERYEKIIVFSRKEIPLTHEKIDLISTDFSDFGSIRPMISGTDLFCCLGTTMKKAGSREAFRETDYQLVVNIAEAAKENGIQNVLVISSVGANAKSRNFYLRTKGEMEEKLQTISFQKLIILRPSLLLGKRNEFRLLEEIGKIVILMFSFLFIGRLRKYRPNKASSVARVMIKLANVTTSKTIIEPNDINLFSNN
jgi:uncharacterized protein YbjT (DUF2867 family)